MRISDWSSDVCSSDLLHYVLSRRTEPYWLAQRDSAHVPPRLAEMLALWRDQPPSAWDFPRVDEIFSAESHQYILYGMGFPVPADRSEEHTSELQSLMRISYAVFCLKKKNTSTHQPHTLRIKK